MNLCKSNENRPMLYILLETGIPIGELSGLDIEEIDFHKRTVTSSQR